MRTLQQTQTLILVPSTVTAACAGGTRTVTNYNQGPTITQTSTIVRTATDGQVTSVWQTTVTATASCHYPESGSPSTRFENIPSNPAPSTGFCIGATCQGFGPGRGKGKGRNTGEASNPTAAGKRDAATVAAIGAVAAVTSTYTQTTFTVTSTVQTTIPGRTVTENGE